MGSNHPLYEELAIICTNAIGNYLFWLVLLSFDGFWKRVHLTSGVFEKNAIPSAFFLAFRTKKPPPGSVM